MRILLLVICVLVSLSTRAQNDSLWYPGYESAIRRADTAFAHKQYEKAKDAYELARAMRPRDKYAGDRIKECDVLIHDIDMRAPEHNYGRYLALGDSCMALSHFMKAKEYYRRASNIKPMEQYPKDKIRLIDGMAICGDRFFPQAIMAGDSLFLAGDYSGAKLRYREAAALRAAESYPREQIAKCDREIAYGSKIQTADSLFRAKDYKGASIMYQEALALKPTELYPAQQILQCDKFLKEEK